MKRCYLIACFSIFGLLSPMVSFAQEDIEDLLKESVEDGGKLISAYLNPFMKSVTMGLNQGWYNTAAPHRIGGMDLTVTVNAMNIPKSDLFFDATKLGLEVVELHASSPDYPMAPTMVGPDRQPVFSYTNENNETYTYSGPGGLDLEEEIGKNWVPVPMAHLGIGLPKGTDLKIRYAPPIDLEDGTMNVFGVGVMHDVKQWIPGLKLLPFHLSGFVGYTKVKMDMQLDPEVNPDQRGVLDMNATTIQGLISKRISILTFYGGVGYSIAKSSIALKGEYDVNEDGTLTPEEIDPLDLKFSDSGMRATVGMRLKLLLLTIHADYTVQEYNCLTAGVGLSFREKKKGI